MSGEIILSLITGFILVIGATCLALHQILVGPDRPNYPTSSMQVRWAMGLWMACLYYRAVEIIALAIGPEHATVTLGQFVSTASLAIVNALLLENVLRQWLPAHTHERIRHLLKLASCGRARSIWVARNEQAAGLWPGVVQNNAPSRVVGHALAELSLEGVSLAGPNETFEAFPEPNSPTPPRIQ